MKYSGRLNLEDFKKVRQKWSLSSMIADPLMYAGAFFAIYLMITGGFHIPHFFETLPSAISAGIIYAAFGAFIATGLAGARLAMRTADDYYSGRSQDCRGSFIGLSLFLMGVTGSAAELTLPVQSAVFLGVVYLFTSMFLVGLYILGTIFPDHYMKQKPLKYRWVFTGLFLSFAGATGAFMTFVSAVPAFSLGMWAMFYVMYWVSDLGITIGYHRLATHRAFQCGKNCIRILFGSGATARQREVRWWGKEHLIHHERTEIEAQDPHTPRESFWHAHRGWVWYQYIYPETIWLHKQFSRGLDDNPLVLEQEKYCNAVMIFGFALPILIFAPIGLWSNGEFNILNGLWAGFIAFTLGLLRFVCSYEITNSVNSWSHTWGPKPFVGRNTGDSTDPWYLAIFSGGENLQNIHHLMDFIACYWVDRWHPDYSGAILVALERLGRFKWLKKIGLPYDLQVIEARRLKFMKEHTVVMNAKSKGVSA